MIGNAVDAEFIRDFVMSRVRQDWQNQMQMWEYGEFCGPIGPDPTPEGWRYLNKGAYRSAWLSPTGVVYKVEHKYDSYNSQSNYGEYQNVLRILTQTRIPEKLRIPRFTYYTLDGRGVSAMEFVDGHGAALSSGCIWGNCDCVPKYSRCVKKLFNEIATAFGMWDTHSENVFFVPAQREFVLVDIGA